MTTQEKQSVIVVAELHQETNTFVATPTELQDFRIRIGDDMLDDADKANVVHGFLSVASQLNYVIFPVCSYVAAPGGIVVKQVMNDFKQVFFERIQQCLKYNIISAIVIFGHGAMVSKETDDVEGALLAWLQSLPDCGEVPIFMTLDPHANVSPTMASRTTCLLAYRENPHVDARETAVRLAIIVDKYLQAAKPFFTGYRHARIMWPPTGTGSAYNPICALEKLARALEKEYKDVIAINVFYGFSHADSQYTGLSFSVTSLNPHEKFTDILQRLCDEAWCHRDEGFPSEMTIETAIQAASAHNELSLIVEPADNIGGGARGDSIAVLKGIINSQLRPAGVILCYPDIIASLGDKVLHSTARITLRCADNLCSDELSLEVEIIHKSAGQFTLSDSQGHGAGHGLTVDMGPTMVVEHHGISILLTSRPTPPWDLAQWTSQGIDPKKFKVIAIKGAIAHRRAYESICALPKNEYFVNTDGPCRSDLRKNIYKRVLRPVYPLDDMVMP